MGPLGISLPVSCGYALCRWFFSLSYLLYRTSVLDVVIAVLQEVEAGCVLPFPDV